jgi:hypothetical protein
MIYSFKISCFPGSYYYISERGLNAGELLLFTILSLILVTFLLIYYKTIPKSNFNESDIQVKRTISDWPKLLIYLLIIIPTLILVIEFFNFGNLFTGFDIFMLSSLTTIMLYLNITPKIIKKIVKKQNLKNPIYQTKDIFLQSNSLDANFIIAERTTSTFVKVFVCILIVLVALTPLYQLLGVEHFL